MWYHRTFANINLLRVYALHTFFFYKKNNFYFLSIPADTCPRRLGNTLASKTKLEKRGSMT